MEDGRYKEYRQYIRVSSVFPVEFYLINGLSECEDTSNIIQGFTRNISKGGLCIEVNNLKPNVARRVESGTIRLGLTIHIPLWEHTNAIAKIAWIRCLKESHPNKYTIGAAYEYIEDDSRKKILKYAKFVNIAPKIGIAVIAGLILVISALFIYAQAERKKTDELARALFEALQTKTALEEKISQLDSDKALLEKKLKSATESAQSISARLKEPLKTQDDLQKLNDELMLIIKEQERLKARLNELVTQKASLSGELLSAKALKQGLEQKGLAQMYGWLKAHQNPRTGLLISYEGDPAIKDGAFTYDEALMIQCFIYYGDIELAKRCINFYLLKAKKVSGGFANAYDANSGDIIEPIAHTGPNIWLGISAAKYFLASGDKKYLSFAESIADWALSIQNQDPEGGLRGGPNTKWYSTEHNLDAYALFSILAKLTGKDKYSNSSNMLLEWLKKYGHNRQENRFNRGKGDSTIATDTLAWAIASIGPERLIKEGLDPDRILEFAEEECRVETTFLRPNKELVEVSGFDFTKASNIARGGIISAEWTGQMVVSYKLMSSFYSKKGDKEKADIYSRKARFYEEELEKLLITSPCKAGHKGWALPYATQDNVETGHGWRTAGGSYTGSASATIYGIFAKAGYNPLGI